MSLATITISQKNSDVEKVINDTIEEKAKKKKTFN